MPRKPEIMSPAGYWPQLRAAVEAGADAVYFGLKHFSARAKVGFSLDELPEVMRTVGKILRELRLASNTVMRELTEFTDDPLAIRKPPRAVAQPAQIQPPQTQPAQIQPSIVQAPNPESQVPAPSAIKPPDAQP